MSNSTKSHAWCFRAWSQAFIACVLFFGCESHPDPHGVRGVLAFASHALQTDDPVALFSVIDERARHAIISIVADRAQSQALIDADYPQDDQRAAASAWQDDDLSGPAAFFARRCDEGCRQTLGENLGAPTEESEDGPEHVVVTTRGSVRLYRANPSSWWGIVWRVEVLDQERNRASRDLRQIEQNAEVYRRRRQLEGAENR